MIGNLLGLSLLFAVVIWLPGRLLSALLVADPAPEERLPTAIGLGVVTVFTAVILVVGALGLAGPFFATRTVVVAVALAISLVCGVLLLRRNDWRWPKGTLWIRPTRNQAAMLALSGLAFTWYLVQYDADQVLEDSCIVQSSMAIDVNFARPELLQRVYSPEALRFLDEDWVDLGQEPANRFLVDYGQRLGPGVLIAPFVAAFGAFGLRLCFALQGLLLPALGFLLGMALLRRRWAAWLLAVLLAFNPWSLDFHVNDENFIALWSGTLALWLLLRPRPAVVASAIAMAMFLGTRHVGVLMLPVLLWYVLTDKRMGVRSALTMGVALVLGCLPYLILHGTFLLTGEDLYEGKPVLFGLPPFAETLLRSPYNGYANILLYPLDLLHRLGLLLAATIPAGLWLLWRTRRRDLLLLLGWMVPIWLVVLPMSNWVEANKIGIPASVLAPVMIAVVAGLVWLADGGVSLPKRAVGGALGLLLMAGFAFPAAAVQTPQDERVYALFGDHPGDGSDGMPAGVPPIVREAAAYTSWDRERYAPRWLPDPGTGGVPLHHKVAGLRVRQLTRSLRRPSVAEHEQPLTDWYSTQLMGPGFFVSALSMYRVAEGGPVAPTPWKPTEAGDSAVIRIDLGLESPPSVAEQPLRLAPSDAAGAPIATADGRPVLITGLRVDWLSWPLNIVIARDVFGTLHVLLLPFEPALVKVPERLGLRVLDGAKFKNVLPLEAPVDGLVRIHDARSYATSRTIVRYATVGPAGTWVSRPAAVQF